MSKHTALTYDTGSFKWSKEEYTLTETLDEFADRRPFAFIVTAGYSGKEDVGADEMYWFHDLVFQPRVVGRDVNDDYLSIPLNYPHKVTPSTAMGEEGPLMTVGDMVRKNIYTTFEFQAKQKHRIIKDASDIGDTELETMEIIKTYDERFLAVHCLLGEAIEEPINAEHTNRNRYIQEGVSYKFELLPVYMPISIAIALDVCEEDTETFERTMYDFKTFVEKQPHVYDEHLKKVADIMVFEEPPSDGDYEYIHILHFIKASSTPIQSTPALPDRNKKQSGKGKKKVLPNPHGTDAPPVPPKNPNKYGPLQPKKGIKHLTDRLPASSSAVMATKSRMTSQSNTNSSDSEDYEQIDEKPYSNMSKEVNLAGRVGPLAMELNPHVVLERIHKLFLSGEVPKSTRKPKPPKPNVDLLSGRRGYDHHQALLKAVRNPVHSRPRRPVTPPDQAQRADSRATPKPLPPPDQAQRVDSRATPKPLPPPGQAQQTHLNTKNSEPKTAPKPAKPTPSVPSKPTVNPALKQTGNRRSTANGVDVATRGSNVLSPGLKDITKIPANIDISTFTISDVSESLRLLNMSEYVDNFREQLVDGDLLQDLSVDDFIKEFAMTSLGAKKLHKFARGWRPQK